MKNILLSTFMVLLTVAGRAQNSAVFTIDVFDTTLSDIRWKSDAAVSALDTAALSAYTKLYTAHKVTRVLDVMSMLEKSPDYTSVLSAMESKRAYFQNLAQSSELLIVPIAKMPLWLSINPDVNQSLNPHWAVYSTHMPAQSAIWDSLVTDIVILLTDEMGITNIGFEIWDEPDQYTWSDNPSDFMDLYRRTYEAIKAGYVDAKIGTPAVYNWGGGFDNVLQRGHLETSTWDNSILHRCIDSIQSWGKTLDFVSIKYYEDGFNTEQCTETILDFQTAIGMANTPIYITAWNQTDTFRESAGSASSYLSAALGFMQNSDISGVVFDTWKDNNTSQEFKKEKGLVSKNLLPKPIYIASQMMAMMPQNRVPIQKTELRDRAIASIKEDTLFLLLTNYSPDPTTEAINGAMEHGEVSLIDLDTQGVIDLGTDYYATLDSVYKGFITLQGNNAAELAVISSAATYGYYTSIAQGAARSYTIDIPAASKNHPAQVYRINQKNNNTIALYNQLKNQGASTADIQDSLKTFLDLKPDTVMYVDSSFTIGLHPNDVYLLKIKIPEILSTSIAAARELSLYPNPCSDYLILTETDLSTYQITDATGAIIRSAPYRGQPISTAELPPGMYILEASSQKGQKYRASFIKK